MAKKQIITNVEMEKDIVDEIKNPPKELEKSYKRFTIPAIIIAILLVAIEFVYPIFILWFLLALIVFLICSAIFNHLRLKNQIKNVTINDYIITTEISEEEYEQIGVEYPDEIMADLEMAALFRKKYIEGHAVILEGWNKLLDVGIG